MARDTTGSNTGHLSTNRTAVKKTDVSGPVPMHHRLKLGLTDGSSNPNGVGNVSKTPSSKGTNNPTGY